MAAVARIPVACSRGGAVSFVGIFDFPIRPDDESLVVIGAICLPDNASVRRRVKCSAVGMKACALGGACIPNQPPRAAAQAAGSGHGVAIDARHAMSRQTKTWIDPMTETSTSSGLVAPCPIAGGYPAPD
ncbi:hypothetical protein [Rhodanobacter sp. DHG33]|uniref:hypothetical protein n=1 Tax=Rhodanobacter sp. DHG33 TaxID=2775921 RepID=UPI00177A86F1|nr:hypothetical protein [Rhodanobacter sp. DHG33]MBD8898504.1 hypothetical protein [Rhodanobacter sp. DHG33]